MNAVELLQIKELWKSIMRKKLLRMAHLENAKGAQDFLADIILMHTVQNAQR